MRRKARGARDRGWIRDHGLALTLFGLFAVFFIAQSVTGWRSHNGDLSDHDQNTLSYRSYLTTGHFAEATFENWESEFLQMAAYVVLTIWLVQKGSSESKPLEGDEELDADPMDARRDPHAPGPVRRGGWQLTLYENSLGIVFAVLFLLSITLHALGGASEYNADRRAHGDRPVSVGSFVTTSTFWFQSFQNWQSEFLAVGSGSWRSRSSFVSGAHPSRSQSRLPTIERAADPHRGGRRRSLQRVTVVGSRPRSMFPFRTDDKHFPRPARYPVDRPIPRRARVAHVAGEGRRRIGC